MFRVHRRAPPLLLFCPVVCALVLLPALALAAPHETPAVAGIPFEFILFAATLAGVALLHRHTLPIAVGGLIVISLYKIAVAPFEAGPGLTGLLAHLGNEWVIIANLFGLLLGFALLSKHFEASRVPEWLPKFLPDDWKGGLVLLVMIFVLSSFLDNIAAALIGGTIARAVFRGKVHIGYLAAIVAASNAGGSGSVVGDTTTTMMWIDGVHPLQVIEAYIAAGVAMLIFGVPASLQQHRYSPITRDAPGEYRHRLGEGRDCRAHAHCGDRRQHRCQRSLRVRFPAAFHSSAPQCGWCCCSAPRFARPLGTNCRVRSRAASSCCRWCSPHR